jgi:dihydroflavonol-4-reductase
VKDDERDLIRPAVDGTLAAMEAALQNKVKRIVITSSTVSVSNQKEKDKPKDFTWSEKHMSDSSKGPHIDGYSRSKTMAEEAAWKFKEENKHIHDIEVVTINPSLILGPAFVGAGFTSGDIIAQILLRKMPGVPKIKFGLVDVRDVARAHLQGLKVPEAANKRFILCKESLFFKEIGVILRKTWKHQGYNPVAKELP